MRAQFFEAENSNNSKLLHLLKSLNGLQSDRGVTFHFEDECCRDDSKVGLPQLKQVLQRQKKQMIKLKGT